MPDNPDMDRPRALLLQIEADPLTDPQGAFDDLSPEEREWFRDHHTWEGEIVTAAEFLLRLRSQRDASPEPAPEPPLPPFRLSDNRPSKPRQMALFSTKD